MTLVLRPCRRIASAVVVHRGKKLASPPGKIICALKNHRLVQPRKNASGRRNAVSSSHSRIEHAAGEIVLGALGNFLENPNADRKTRPVVILRSGNCQHLAVGLTSKGVYRTTGVSRRPVPNPIGCGLFGPGFLWGSRPSRISRIDIRKHLGWVDQALVEVIAETMKVSPDIVESLEKAAVFHHGPGGWQCDL